MGDRQDDLGLGRGGETVFKVSHKREREQQQQRKTSFAP